VQPVSMAPTSSLKTPGKGRSVTVGGCSPERTPKGRFLRQQKRLVLSPRSSAMAVGLITNFMRLDRPRGDDIRNDPQALEAR
jgi:hypothetical protein